MLFTRNIAASHCASRKNLVWLDTCGLFSSGCLGGLYARVAGQKPQNTSARMAMS